MDEYKVDIRFPKQGDDNIVIISGEEENVLDAKDHLLNLAEEYVSNENHVILKLNYQNDLVYIKRNSKYMLIPGKYPLLLLNYTYVHTDKCAQ